MLGAALACSAAPPPCVVALGTSVATLPRQKLARLYPTYGSDGRVNGWNYCCAGGPAYWLPDGGCGPVCTDPPPMDLFTLTPPNGGGVCDSEFGGGHWSGLVGAIDGGVVYATCSCVD